MDIEQYDIFLSYSHEDFISARMIANYLEARGCKVWMATDVKSFSRPITRKILTGLKNSKMLVALISLHYENDSYQDKEIEWATNRTTIQYYPIVPLILPGAKQLYSDNFLGLTDTIDIEAVLENELSKLDIIECKKKKGRKAATQGKIKSIQVLRNQVKLRRWDFEILVNSIESIELSIEVTNRYVNLYINKKIVSQIESFFTYEHVLGFNLKTKQVNIVSQVYVKINKYMGIISKAIITIDTHSITFK